MTKKLCFLEVPVSIHELRKTYDDSVDFVTEVGIYPNVTAIAFDGMLSKAIRGKTTLKSIKPRVDRLLELYKRRLFRFWDDHTESLVDTVVSAGMQKDEEGDTKKKRAVIAAALAGLGVSLAGNALDYYKRAYLLGKERGVSISGKDFRAAITEEANKKLRGLTADNNEYLKNFMKDLEDKYVEAAQKEYASAEAAKEEARRIAQAHEARLAMYAFAALAALAIGMTDGIKESQPAPKEPTDAGPTEEPSVAVQAEVITGIVWVTSHDDAVCAGCADNDGKFFTFDEFEAEYQQNECLVRCRCAETSVPTTMPPSHFGKSMKLSKLQKGGPGSGCRGPNCGRPKESDAERDKRHGSEMHEIGKHVYETRPLLSAFGTGVIDSGSIKMAEPKVQPLHSSLDNIVVSAASKGRLADFTTHVGNQLDNYPEHMQKMLSKSVTRINLSYTMQPNVAGEYDPLEKTIEINEAPYSNPHVGPGRVLRRDVVLTHELAHALDHANADEHGVTFSESRSWKDAMKSGRPITAYAKRNQREYFAESVAAYLYVPDKLKEANPKAYEVLDKFFSNDTKDLVFEKAVSVRDDSIIRDDFTDSLAEILAQEDEDVQKGGPGSGCQGPNCGRPKGSGSTLAYHGTTADFDVFETEPKNKKSFSGLGETSIGAFFSEDADTAASYPLYVEDRSKHKVREVELDIRNPKKYTSLNALRNDLTSFMEQQGLSFDTRERLGNAQKFKEHLESQGYDGLTFLEGKAHDTAKDKKRVWSAFSPKQIKINKFEKGGPGSGCHGPNCGRPRGSGDTSTIETDASLYSDNAVISDDGSVHTSNIDDAALALSRNKKVVLSQPKQVSTLLLKLKQMAADADARGEKAPVYNLCNVSVNGTNLFCSESKGVPRVLMPQLKGIPIPGSKAASLTPDSRGEVDITDNFREYLSSKGIGMTDDDERADYLKATQNELNGAKVAGIAGAIRANKLDKARLFVSKDNYIVDGHHRWAATVAVDLDDNNPGDLRMPVARVDMDIIELLQASNDFAREYGIPQSDVTKMEKGGPGSGCNPEVGTCGRPRGSGGGTAADFLRGDRKAHVAALKKTRVTKFNARHNRDMDMFFGVDWIGQDQSGSIIRLNQMFAESQGGTISDDDIMSVFSKMRPGTPPQFGLLIAQTSMVGVDANGKMVDRSAAFYDSILKEKKFSEERFKETFGDSAVVYKGIPKKYGDLLERSGGDTVHVKDMPLSSYTIDRDVAKKFAGSGGVVLERTVRADEVVFGVHSHPAFNEKYGENKLGEGEIVVLNKSAYTDFKKDQIKRV